MYNTKLISIFDLNKLETKMAQTQEKVFAQGLFANKKKFDWGEITALSFKVEEFKAFLDANVNDKGYVNVDLKSTKADETKLYGEVNTYVPKESILVSEDEDTLPF